MQYQKLADQGIASCLAGVWLKLEQFPSSEAACFWPDQVALQMVLDSTSHMAYAKSQLPDAAYSIPS